MFSSIVNSKTVQYDFMVVCIIDTVELESSIDILYMYIYKIYICMCVCISMCIRVYFLILKNQNGTVCLFCTINTTST